jgi:hypothetical protein
MLEGGRNKGRYPLRKVALFLSLFALPLVFAATAVAAPPESETILVSRGGCITSALTGYAAVEVVGAVLGTVSSGAGRGVGAVAAG